MDAVDRRATPGASGSSQPPPAPHAGSLWRACPRSLPADAAARRSRGKPKCQSRKLAATRKTLGDVGANRAHLGKLLTNQRDPQWTRRVHLCEQGLLGGYAGAFNCRHHRSLPMNSQTPALRRTPPLSRLGIFPLVAPLRANSRQTRRVVGSAAELGRDEVDILGREGPVAQTEFDCPLLPLTAGV
jgi:hypothetical protein